MGDAGGGFLLTARPKEGRDASLPARHGKLTMQGGGVQETLLRSSGVQVVHWGKERVEPVVKVLGTREVNTCCRRRQAPCSKGID
jgi:hypothetical protein